MYRIGKNAKNNSQLVKDADKNDWWFHLKNDSSSHIILESDKLTQENLDEVVQLYKNKLGKSKIEIVYTQIKNLKLTKNPGQVKFIGPVFEYKG